MPGPDTVLAGPPGWLVTAAQLVRGTPDSNSTIDAQIAAARAAGYTGTRPQLIAIGQGIISQDAFALGQGAGPGGDRTAPGRPTANVPAVIPQPPPPFNPPSTTVYYPPPEPPSASPPGGGGSGRPPSGGTPGINPNAPAPNQPGAAFPSMWPYVIGQVAGPSVLDAILRANEYANAAWSVILGGPRPIPKGPTNPRGRSPDAGRGNPWPPAGPPPVTVIVNMPPAPREPAARARQPDPMAGLGRIFVTKKRLRVPTSPPPKPPPPPKTPLWLQLLPIIGPTLLGSVFPARGDRNVLRLTDPLSQPQTSPLTTFNTSVSSYGAFGGSGAVGTNTCECKAPRKKGRKKKRTVCYSGTYTERADGLRKTKKRKVPCK